MGKIFHVMFRSALDGEPDAGGLVPYNALSGEPILGLKEGRPMLVRTPEAALNFPNFMRAQLYGALAALKLGMEILDKENVRVERLSAHGGFFKTPEAGQRIMAAATGTPVSVMETAGEGGAWGMALLAAFRAYRKVRPDAALEDFLATQVFAEQRVVTVEPLEDDRTGFQTFMEQFQDGLAVEQSAVKFLR